VRPHDIPTLWNEAGAKAIISKVVDRNRPFFGRFPEIPRTQLIKQCLDAARGDWNGGRFDPWRSPNLSTWLERVGQKTLNGIARGLKAQTSQEQPASPRQMLPAARVIHEAHDPAIPLHIWLGEIADAARTLYPPKKHRRGRKWFELWQLATTALLMQQLAIGSGYCIQVLSAREDLRRVLGFAEDRLPTDRHLRNAAQFLRSALESGPIAEVETVPQGDKSNT
jgi:hypothetical protein